MQAFSARSAARARPHRMGGGCAARPCLSSAWIFRRPVDRAGASFKSVGGPRRPNAARALCKESLMTATKPDTRPARPYFSSGPCAKPPGWAPEKLATGSLGRSHRAKLGKARLGHALALMRDLLRLPDTHRI